MPGRPLHCSGDFRSLGHFPDAGMGLRRQAVQLQGAQGEGSLRVQEEPDDVFVHGYLLWLQVGDTDHVRCDHASHDHARYDHARYDHARYDHASHNHARYDPAIHDHN